MNMLARKDSVVTVFSIACAAMNGIQTGRIDECHFSIACAAMND